MINEAWIADCMGISSSVDRVHHTNVHFHLFKNKSQYHRCLMKKTHHSCLIWSADKVNKIAFKTKLMSRYIKNKQPLLLKKC